MFISEQYINEGLKDTAADLALGHMIRWYGTPSEQKERKEELKKRREERKAKKKSKKITEQEFPYPTEQKIKELRGDSDDSDKRKKKHTIEESAQPNKSKSIKKARLLKELERIKNEISMKEHELFSYISSNHGATPGAYDHLIAMAEDDLENLKRKKHEIQEKLKNL